MNPYLIISVEFGPVVLERLFHQLPANRWDEALVPDRFTVREVIAHCADWEPISLSRMQAAVEHPGSRVEAFDEVEMARLNVYASRDPIKQAEQFRADRAKTAAWLRDRSEDDWGKIVFHPEKGVMTLDDQANMLLGHDIYHIEQLSAYLDL